MTSNGNLPSSSLNAVAAPQTPVVKRGEAGDFWADTVIGKRDFGEISPQEIVPYKIFDPGGVVVDRSISPGRLYVWDAGNNRILGLDLAKCDSSTAPCSADIVIGQPSGFDYGGCNLDSSFSTHPYRRPASASTLCGIRENTHTTLEDKTAVSFYVDQNGNLYVPDSFNHRVLKYNRPFTTDTVADEAWGQPDFTSNGCNLTGGIGGNSNPPNPKPTNQSLCFHSINGDGSGVTLDQQGNLWVADGGNHRVLRFPNIGGSIAKTADLVLGQPDFTSGSDWGNGSNLNQMYSPSAVRVDTQNNVYVADTRNNRVLVFKPPFENGMNGSLFLAGISSPFDIEIDPLNRGTWVAYINGGPVLFQLYGFDGVKNNSFSLEVGDLVQGSFDFDSQNNLLYSAYNCHKVYIFGYENGQYQNIKELFSDPPGYNLPSLRRLGHPSWVGMAVAGNQLIIGQSRLLFWNNTAELTNGQAPNGAILDQKEDSNTDFGQMAVDQQNRLWIANQDEIRVYQTPLTSSSLPLKTINSFPILGGGTMVLRSNWGLAISPDSQYLWLSENDKHQVYRVRNPFSPNPLVDIILGQTSYQNYYCNNDPNDPHNTSPWGGSPPARGTHLDGLCWPGGLGLDKFGNLYISDHFPEVAGNKRLLLFSANSFPAQPTSLIYGANQIFAQKEFPGDPATPAHFTFQPGFDSANRLVIGFNPYRYRLVGYYLDPLDPTQFKPNGYLNDFYGWPVAITFDFQDNLYVYDANRGQVRIYKTPFQKEGDLNKDGQVNLQDAIILLQNYGSSPANPRADLNSDGVVNGMDFEKLRKLIP